MTLRPFFVPLLLAFAAADCGRTTPPAPPAAGAATSRKTEVVLTPADQANGQIETRPAAVSHEPPILRVAGRIVRADDRTWRVGVRAQGIVDRVPVEPGEMVKAGQVLATYHADEAREARAQYLQARSDLHRAEAAAALAERNADRMKTLLSLKAASVQQTEQAQQDALAAQAALRDVQIEVDRARTWLEHDLHVPADLPAGADPEAANEVPIIAPGTGYIIEKNVTPGRTVDPAADAFVIADLSTVWMIAPVRPSEVTGLQVGQPVTVALPGGPASRFAGTITNLGQEIDPTTRRLPIRITLANPNRVLRPEMLATAELPIGPPAPRLLVPSDAVQQVNGQDVVFVRSAPDRFELRPIHAGQIADGQVTVVEGLKEGEQVVVRGSFVLKSQLLRASLEGE